jgi:predicted transcriptional regulator
VAQLGNLQKMLNATDETLNVSNMINKALIGILISKEIVTEEEMIVILGKINSQQENYLEQQNRP